MKKDTTIAVDIAKNVFEIAVSAQPGRVSERKRCSRSQMLPFFRGREPSAVVLEACGAAQELGRSLTAMGTPSASCLRHTCVVTSWEARQMLPTPPRFWRPTGMSRSSQSR